MSLYVIGDTHLSFGTDKPMDIFGGWNDYTERLKNNWQRLVNENDTVVINGDISWAMSLDEAFGDFEFLNSLNGTKIILKGNHDFWWSTKTKIEKFFKENGFDTLKILHNNAYRVGEFSVAGSRGWFFDDEADSKVMARECARIERSILAAKELGGETVVFLHYPPVSQTKDCEQIIEVLARHKIKRCYYGHLHGAAAKYAFCGEKYGIDFRLCSADYLEFCPKCVYVP